MNNKEGIILLFDPGHGADNNTNGKYSPILHKDEFNLDDETVYGYRFREGNFNRCIVARLVELFKGLGVDARDILNGDKKDVSLGERVRRVNEIVRENRGKKQVYFISVHSNAAGSDEWSNARGLSVHCCRGCSNKAKILAQHIYDAAMPDFKGNRSVPDDKIWYNGFYVLTKTSCPAVLLENLFYTNREDLKILMSKEGREQIAQYIYRGICNTLFA